MDGSYAGKAIYEVILFFFDLDEYFNVKAANDFGVNDREYILGTYESDYKETLKKALEKEKKELGSDGSKL